MKKHIAIGILTLLLFIASCSSRKVQVEKVVAKSNVAEKVVSEKHADSVANIKKEVVISVSDDGSVITEVTTVTPIDPNKEATVKNTQGVLVTMTNAVYRLERMITKKKYALKKQIKENKAIQVKKTANASAEKHAKESKEEYVRKLDKKTYLSPWLLLIAIPALCCAAGYVYYKANPTSRLFSLFKRQ